MTKKKRKSSRKLMACRICKGRRSQSPGTYIKLNEKQEAVTFRNRAFRRNLLSRTRNKKVTEVSL